MPEAMDNISSATTLGRREWRVKGFTLPANLSSYGTSVHLQLPGHSLYVKQIFSTSLPRESTPPLSSG
jgi:hypothetical protein